MDKDDLVITNNKCYTVAIKSKDKITTTFHFSFYVITFLFSGDNNIMMR